LSVNVLSIEDVHAETIVADGRPVVVLVTSVVPLHVSVPLSFSENNSSTSVVFVLFNTESVGSVVKISDVSRNGVEEELLVSSVLGFADSDLVLVTTNMSSSVQDSSATHARLDEERLASLHTSAMDLRSSNFVVSLEPLVGAIVVSPQNDRLSISVSSTSNIDGKFLIAEGVPVVVLSTSVLPFLARIMLVSSQDKACTSGVFTLFDSDNPMRISLRSNVASSWIEVEELLLVVLGSADGHWVLISSHLSFFPEQNSASMHSGPDEERFIWSQVGALVDRLGNRVSYFKSLVQAVVAVPHDDSLVVNVLASKDVHAEVRVERLPVVVLVFAVLPLLIRGPLSCSENDLGSSISVSLKNTESIVSVEETSNVAGLRVEVHEFVLGILRLANGSLELTVGDFVVEEHDSSI
jgi:hypothetical protein